MGEQPQALLEAINDRGITRLVVEDGAPRRLELDRGGVASARGRIVTCLAYSPSGRVRDGDVRIAGNDSHRGVRGGDPRPGVAHGAAPRRRRGRPARVQTRSPCAPARFRAELRAPIAVGAPSSSRTAARSRPTAASAWTRPSRCSDPCHLAVLTAYTVVKADGAGRGPRPQTARSPPRESSPPVPAPGRRVGGRLGGGGGGRRGGGGGSGGGWGGGEAGGREERGRVC